MADFRAVPLEVVYDLRKRVLTPGHPGRPVVWPYDADAIHYALYVADVLVACVSVTQQELPDYASVDVPVVRPYHLHSMAVEDGYRRRQMGRQILGAALDDLRRQGADLAWATARLSAVEFYRRSGFEVGPMLIIAITKVEMQFIWAAI